jgi:hypothetical protein
MRRRMNWAVLPDPMAAARSLLPRAMLRWSQDQPGKNVGTNAVSTSWVQVPSSSWVKDINIQQVPALSGSFDFLER